MVKCCSTIQNFMDKFDAVVFASSSVIRPEMEYAGTVSFYYRTLSRENTIVGGPPSRDQHARDQDRPA